MANSLIRRHAQRLCLTPEQLSAALLRYAVHQLADWTEEQENDDPGSVWCVGDPPDFLENFMPEDWLERYREATF
jgi:hypothetical protein